MSQQKNSSRTAIIWGKWGPYHYARYNSVVKIFGESNCLGIELASGSTLYQWKPVEGEYIRGEVVTLNPGMQQEMLNPLKTAVQVYRTLRKFKVKVAFLPSYWPLRSFAVFIATKMAGAKCVMMNESHAGTEKAKGFSKWIKKQLVRRFDAALVGGSLHTNYFNSIGMPREKIFHGYDVIDNQYFYTNASAARVGGQELKIKFGLPEKYLLSLGRMVEKKNLSILIKAYAVAMLKEDKNVIKNYSLVMIGSGNEEATLRKLALESGLRVAELTPGQIPEGNRTVFFGGFRDIDQNPMFYALSSLFILPSIREEWGLVVNEAMACGLPVIVSSRAGCAPDLVKDGINGFHFDPVSADDLAGKIQTIMHDATLAEKMGEESLHIISQWDCSLFGEGIQKATQAATKCSKNIL